MQARPGRGGRGELAEGGAAAPGLKSITHAPPCLPRPQVCVHTCTPACWSPARSPVDMLACRHGCVGGSSRTRLPSRSHVTRQPCHTSAMSRSHVIRLRQSAHAGPCAAGPSGHVHLQACAACPILVQHTWEVGWTQGFWRALTGVMRTRTSSSCSSLFSREPAFSDTLRTAGGRGQHAGDARGVWAQAWHAGARAVRRVGASKGDAGDAQDAQAQRPGAQHVWEQARGRQVMREQEKANKAGGPWCQHQGMFCGTLCRECNTTRAMVCLQGSVGGSRG